MTISSFVENAVKYQILEDLEDLEDAKKRENEPALAFDDLVKQFRTEGLLLTSAPTRMYKLLYKQSVEKELRKLSAQIRNTIVRKIQMLAHEPRPASATKIRGSDNVYRIRPADYRVIYRIDDNVLTILILKAGHRREVYRDL